MSFSELLSNNIELLSGTIQNTARAEFPKLLKEKRLNLRGPKGWIPDKGTLILLGIAAGYSTTDLALLDEIYPALVDRNDERIEIFDASSFTKMDDWEDYIPNITPVYHTPVIGVCKDANWIVRKSGYAAREFIRSHYLKLPT